ncbi:MAG: hypothetical protein LUF27_07100 [Lachnospiraceae bacterium]|nr:hypothetical protein [Lachnospiraceae bacterium]
MKKKTTVMLMALCMAAASVSPAAGYLTVLAEESEADSGNDYFQSLNADEVNIQDTGIYTIRLQAKEGWQFDVADNTDVTAWIVDADGNPAFSNESGVAFAVNGEDFELDITIDASKISGFTTNGSGELYVHPTGGNPLVVEGDNHGQYTEVSEFVGVYTIPEVVVVGTIEGESGTDGYLFTEDTVTITLNLDGIDDSLIDSSASVVKLLEGDGYYLTDYSFEDDTLNGEWSGGTMTYSMTTEEFTGDFSPLGGDGNGNYYANIGVSGLFYNGLPLAEATFRVHVYSYGRTFTIESNGSLINDTEPLWSTTAEDDLPVLCDAYPDELNITWPIDFDASALTVDDFTLTMCSGYGDELVLEPETDFTVETDKDQTSISVTYIYWANIPVYTTLKVDVNIENLTWDSAKYTVTSVSHEYDIASVYAYYIMSGGMTGTQSWTYYGIDGLTEWSQAFVIPTYTLTYTAEDGTVSYYTEDESGNAMFTDAADDAMEFDSTEDNNCQVVNNTGSFERVYDQTQDVVVDGVTYTCDKVYANADNMPLDPADCTGITAKAGYIIGDSWEMHGRWPWQTFVNEGYLGGSK